MFYSIVIALVTAVPAWASAPVSTGATQGDSASFAQVSQARRGAMASPAPRGRTAQATAVSRVDAVAARVRARLAELSRVAAEMRTLKPTYELQLRAVDRLKRRRASWRRDNQIRGQLKKAQAIARRLGVLARRVRIVRSLVRRERVALQRALRVELRARPGAVRRAKLVRLQRQNRRALRPVSRKIVLPDARIDPLADPEDLDDQAARILQAEKRLAHEIAGLETRARRYERMVKLRRKRQRAAELGGLDDDRPRRSTGRLSAKDGSRDGAGGGFGSPSSDDVGGGSPAPSETATGDASGFSSDPIVVLADVVDSQTLDALRRAGVSTNPAVKAKAATRARAQVKARLERLRRRRLLIERRARKLRAR